MLNKGSLKRELSGDSNNKTIFKENSEWNKEGNGKKRYTTEGEVRETSGTDYIKAEPNTYHDHKGQGDSKKRKKENDSILPYTSTFAYRIGGSGQVNNRAIISKHSARLIPYIIESNETIRAPLAATRKIIQTIGKIRKLHSHEIKTVNLLFVHFTEELREIVNNFLSRHFWKGIDSKYITTELN